MGADLEVDFKRLESELTKLDKAIKTFEPYSKDFMENTLKIMEGFNSDFISKMEETLDNMRDTEAPKLVEELRSYSSAVGQAKDAFKDVDKEYAKDMKGGGVDGK